MSEVWNRLSKLNVNDDKEKKGKFDYLSWADAWKSVQNNSDSASYTMDEDIVYPDTTREVRSTVTIDGVSHMMWLAVMDHNNRAIKNPDAAAINKSRMRCLVKTIAMHGIGLYIYAGEDLPDVDPAELLVIKNHLGDEKGSYDPQDFSKNLINLIATYTKIEATKTGEPVLPRQRMTFLRELLEQNQTSIDELSDAFKEQIDSRYKKCLKILGAQVEK
tara:strand:+ start:489 stop:1142 length:654 start_codon:yes stop_codon:yes gene_type:complete